MQKIVISSNLNIFRSSKDLKIIPTSHLSTLKKVYFTTDECESNLTQIAKATLLSGQVIEEHLHQTMEEVFFMLEGECLFIVEDKEFLASKHDVVKIPPGCKHSLKCVTTCEFYYFGVAIKDNS